MFSLVWWLNEKSSNDPLTEASLKSKRALPLILTCCMHLFYLSIVDTSNWTSTRFVREFRLHVLVCYLGRFVDIISWLLTSWSCPHCQIFSWRIKWLLVWSCRLDLGDDCVDYQSKDKSANAVDHKVTYAWNFIWPKTDLSSSSPGAYEILKGIYHNDKQKSYDMHHDNHLVNHQVAKILNKFYHPADAPNQNDTWNNQRQLLKAYCNVCITVFFLDVIYPNDGWYNDVVKTYYDVDCVESTVKSVFWLIICNKLNAIRKNKVAESEDPMR